MLRSGPDLLRLLLSSLPLFLCAFEDPLLQEARAQSRSIMPMQSYACSVV